jgi:ABC-type nickel/cobalt efflux system permease component RcnA
MEAMLPTVAGVGLLFGLRHALDPDHVAAVSTIVAERRGLRRASLVGTCWGVGHALSLTVVGGAVLALKLNVPEPLACTLEAVVATLLVALGVGALRAALRYRVHAHAHAHDGREHLHFHAHRRDEPHAHRHGHALAGGLRPFAVGLVHGLAGSAGLALVALGAAPTWLAGLVYVATLGVGSALGMIALSALLSLPLTLLESRYAAIQRRLQLAAGAWSCGLGLYLLAINVPQALVALFGESAPVP